jgi:hypothetical protein
MSAYQMLCLAASAVSTVFGGVGVFAVYLSFRDPIAGASAILLLGTALAMQRALPIRK